MIRLFISALMLTISGTMPASAMSNGDLYKYCKPLADRAFKHASEEDLYCGLYFIAIGEMIHLNCLAGIESGVPYDYDKLDSVIQHYVNKIQDKPEGWEYSAAYEVWESMEVIFSSNCPPS